MSIRSEIMLTITFSTTTAAMKSTVSTTAIVPCLRLRLLKVCLRAAGFPFCISACFLAGFAVSSGLVSSAGETFSAAGAVCSCSMFSLFDSFMSAPPFSAPAAAFDNAHRQEVENYYQTQEEQDILQAENAGGELLILIEHRKRVDDVLEERHRNEV